MPALREIVKHIQERQEKIDAILENIQAATAEATEGLKAARKAIDNINDTILQIQHIISLLQEQYERLRARVERLEKRKVRLGGLFKLIPSWKR